MLLYVLVYIQQFGAEDISVENAIFVIAFGTILEKSGGAIAPASLMAARCLNHTAYHYGFKNSFLNRLVKAKSALKKKQQLLPNISKTDLEDALLQLEFQHNCCVHFCESAEELAQLVCSFTKAVAEKPYKYVNYCSTIFILLFNCRSIIV